MQREADDESVKLLGESVLRSAYFFIQRCHRLLGFVINLNRFKIALHLEDGTGRGILTFTTELADIQRALQEVLPYRSQLFRKEVTNIQLEEMRVRMSHLPPERFEALRIFLDKERKQRAIVRQMSEELHNVALLRYHRLPEPDRVDVQITFLQEDVLWPASYRTAYRNIGVSFPFLPPPQDRPGNNVPLDGPQPRLPPPPQERRRRPADNVPADVPDHQYRRRY